MVERALSMREAQGSIPCFSISFVVFQRKNKKKARLCSLREPSQNLFFKNTSWSDGTKNREYKPWSDETHQNKIPTVRIEPMTFRLHKPSQAMWTGLFESKVNLGPKTFRQAVDYFFLIYCFARANIKDVHTGLRTRVSRVNYTEFLGFEVRKCMKTSNIDQ